MRGGTGSFGSRYYLGIALGMCPWAQGAFSADKQEEWLYNFQPVDILWGLMRCQMVVTTCASVPSTVRDWKVKRVTWHSCWTPGLYRRHLLRPLQLSADKQFQSQKIDKKDIPGVRIELDTLATETWYRRIASSFQGEPGPWGVVQRFSLKPAPITPSVESVVDDDILHLHWQKQREGQTYRLQLAEDAGFRRILLDEVLDEPLWSVQRPQSVVHFRVQVIDDDGYAGAWSPAQAVFPKPEPWYLFGVPAIAIVPLAL